jgi:hypothetical protein
MTSPEFNKNQASFTASNTKYLPLTLFAMLIQGFCAAAFYRQDCSSTFSGFLDFDEKLIHILLIVLAGTSNGNQLCKNINSVSLMK